jgi:predicted polyphosphate/ATP-dependent NAD kinase
VLANGFEGAVNEDADVAFFVGGDGGDLLVAEAVGPKVEGFALIGW